ADHPSLGGRRLLFETIRRMLSQLVYDVIEHTGERLQAAGPRDADEARRVPPLVGFGDATRRELVELKRFLFQALYRHPQVVAKTDAGRRVVCELFAAYVGAPSEMPPDYAGAADLQRAVADYIAGMTDRFALREHRNRCSSTTPTAMPTSPPCAR
ncbi:MAG: hypothetical protein MUE62_10130, partial [Burkholderiaceae bacterium]|nr:hypothetical protein [Burkholderiaceae bacterium]